METINKVTATEITKKDGSKTGKFRYTATLENGSTEIIRASATRLYEKAFYYGDLFVATGKKGLASNFTFGKNPTSWHKDDVISVTNIEFVS